MNAKNASISRPPPTRATLGRNMAADTTQSGTAALSASDEALVIVLPLPAKELSSNGPQGDYRGKAVARARARKLAWVSALDAIGLWHVPYARCWATVQFYYPDGRRRDTSNSFSACKAYWDGFTDASIWDDDQHVAWIIPLPLISKDDPCMIVTIVGTG